MVEERCDSAYTDFPSGDNESWKALPSPASVSVCISTGYSASVESPTLDLIRSGVGSVEPGATLVGANPANTLAGIGHGAQEGKAALFVITVDAHLVRGNVSDIEDGRVGVIHRPKGRRGVVASNSEAGKAIGDNA